MARQDTLRPHHFAAPPNLCAGSVNGQKVSELAWGKLARFRVQMAANLVRVTLGLRLRLRVGRLDARRLNTRRRQPRVPHPVLIFFLLTPYPFGVLPGRGLSLPRTPRRGSNHVVFNSPLLYIIVYPLNLFYVYFKSLSSLSFSCK
jgi:hypothetical protein